MCIRDRTGSLPAPPDFSKLNHASFQNNNLSGTLDQFLAPLSKLRVLNVSNNNIEGPIPDSLTANTSLASLSLQDNRLSGTLPANIGSLVECATFRVDGNQLSGEVPVSIQSLPGPIVLLRGQSGCLTADSATAAFIDGFDQFWDNGCN